MVKRTFTIDTGSERIDVEGYDYQKVAVKYLMKRRRSLLSTRDPTKVEGEPVTRAAGCSSTRTFQIGAPVSASTAWV